MTTLENRPNTALVVVDVQNGVVATAHERDAVVAKIAGLVERAREEGVPVVWVRHNDGTEGEGLLYGSGDWEIVPELVPAAGESIVDKRWGDSFEATDLEEVLAGLKVGRIFVAGAQTDACIRSTLHGGFARGYDTILVGDAHTADDNSEWGAPPPAQVIAHTNLYWKYHAGPGRTGGTVEAKDVDFAA